MDKYKIYNINRPYKASLGNQGTDSVTSLLLPALPAHVAAFVLLAGAYVTVHCYNNELLRP